MTINSFEPITDDKAKVLILGTMPSIASLEAKQYYGHRDNLFWDIMFRVLDKNWNCEEVVSADYETKKNLLLKNRVALWDVLQYCERKGNLDKAIRNEIKNDLLSFFKTHSNIKAIFFNGQKAQKYFLDAKEHVVDLKNTQQFVLPSTSPSNTKNSFHILKEWISIRNFLNSLK